MEKRYTRCDSAWGIWGVLCGLIVWILAGCTFNKKKPGISEVASEAEFSKPRSSTIPFAQIGLVSLNRYFPLIYGIGRLRSEISFYLLNTP